MLIITSKHLKLAQVETEYRKQHPYLWDAWLSRPDIRPDVVAPGEVVPVKAEEPEFEPTNKMSITVRGLFPPQNKDVSPFLWKERDSTEPNIIRWIWHPVTGQMVLEPGGEYSSHATMIPYDWENSRSGPPFEEWVRGFWMPKEKKIFVRPYFKPRNMDDKWDDSHAVVNAKVMRRITELLRTHLEPLVGPVKIVANVNNDDVQRLTGLRRV